MSRRLTYFDFNVCSTNFRIGPSMNLTKNGTCAGGVDRLVVDLQVDGEPRPAQPGRGPVVGPVDVLDVLAVLAPGPRRSPSRSSPSRVLEGLAVLDRHVRSPPSFAPLRRSSQSPTTSTSSVLGPWTPSTRFSSMSDVAEGPEMNVIGRPGRARPSREPGDGLGDEADDLVLADDAEVIVGQERERPPPLAGAAVEDDRPGLGDPQGAAGQDAVARLELVDRQARVAEQRRRPAGAQPSGRSAGTTSRRTPRAAQRRGDRRRQRRRPRPGGRSPCIRRRARRTARPGRSAVGRVGRAVVAGDGRRRRAVSAAGTSREGLADPAEDRVLRGRSLMTGSSTTRGRSAGATG